MAWMGFPDSIRISIGSSTENTKLLHALSTALPRHSSLV
jgi:histidinol-phosphate/aromatic aminotransferase/cobyric acid decarboxylase-like protein